jgi:hypothetical protein
VILGILKYNNSPLPNISPSVIFISPGTTLPKFNIFDSTNYFRYTFYWKFCVNSEFFFVKQNVPYDILAVKNCTGEYAFTFLSDRFMLKAEVNQIKFTKSLEECLSECLKSTDILCRSVSFNRTDGGWIQIQIAHLHTIKKFWKMNFRMPFVSTKSIEQTISNSY